jgi:hypothetical protein
MILSIVTWQGSLLCVSAAVRAEPSRPDHDCDDTTVSVGVVCQAGLAPGQIFTFARTAAETTRVMSDEDLRRGEA